jgi:antitoxin (DNA-binding transcriptional repressor) of toxin-antitoxin stability system
MVKIDFMKTLTFAQVKTSVEQAIDIVNTGEALTITQDGQPAAMLFSFNEGSELMRLRHTARLDAYLAVRSENATPGAPALSMDDINKLVNELRT